MMEDGRTPFEYSDEELQEWIGDVYLRHAGLENDEDRILQSIFNVATVISSLVQLGLYEANQADDLVNRISVLTGMVIPSEDLIL